MKMRRILLSFLIVLFGLLATDVCGKPPRTSKQVRKEKQQTEKQIKQARERIRKNEAEVSRHLHRLEALKAQISSRADSISVLTARVDSLDTAIGKLTDSIEMLTERHKRISDSYARTLATIRARRQGMSDVAFIFSAANFSQAWRRMRYLKQVATAATAEARRVKTTAAQLDTARKALEPLRERQAAVLASVKSVQAAQRTEQVAADILVKDLKRQGSALNKELKKRSEQAAALDRELDRLIAAEIEAARKAEEEARRKAEEALRREQEKQQQSKPQPSKPSSEKPATPQQTPSEKPSKRPVDKPTERPASQPALTGKFADAKGRLISPVTGSYIVVSGFGTNAHSELSSIQIQNHGIDIKTAPGASARSVFGGVVTSVSRLDGYHNVVIVRHGEYLTVYAGIASLAVRKGDEVQPGQLLGTIYSDPAEDNRTVLHFEIRKETQKLNPAEWLRR